MANTKKLFIISAVSREQIAELLNDALDCCGPEGDDGIDRFTANDPRLTDENCQAIADRLHDATDTSEDDERSMIELVEEADDNDWLFKMPKSMGKKAKKS